MLEARREFFPTISVANRVVWVNPNIFVPYHFEIEQPTELGVFLVNSNSRLNPAFFLGVDYIHGRTGLLPPMQIFDNTGVVYHDADLKGTGFIQPDFSSESINIAQIQRKDDQSSYGIWSLVRTFRERDITEDLTRAGARIYRISMITELLEIALPYGSKISVKEAKDMGMMNTDETPVISLRVYKNRERVRNLPYHRKEYLVVAKDRLERELNISLSWFEYVKWFAETLGTNLATVHNNGYWHGFLDDHNVTLVAEIVDFGFGHQLDRKRLEDHFQDGQRALLADDFKMARKTLAHLMWDVIYIQGGIPRGVNFGAIMEDAYKKTASTHVVPDWQNDYWWYTVKHPLPPRRHQVMISP